VPGKVGGISEDRTRLRREVGSHQLAVRSLKFEALRLVDADKKYEGSSWGEPREPQQLPALLRWASRAQPNLRLLIYLILFMNLIANSLQPKQLQPPLPNSLQPEKLLDG
jgi:hypothetical protein